MLLYYIHYFAFSQSVEHMRLSISRMLNEYITYVGLRQLTAR